MQSFLFEWKPPPVPPEIQDKAPSPRKIYEFYREDRTRFQNSLIAYLHHVRELLNTGTQGFGPELTAANSITIQAYQHVVNGTGTIQYVRTVPNLPASHVTLISKDGFTLTTGGNISFGKNVKANQAVMLVWEPISKFWYPIVSVTDIGDLPNDPTGGHFSVSAIDINRRALIDFTQPGHIGQVLPQLYDYTATWQAGHAYSGTVYITDSNGNVQQLTTAGTSGGSPPTWNVTLGGSTTDGTAVWENVGGSGAASIILQSAKYLLVETHQATPAELRFATAAGVTVSKFTKGATAATDLDLIPATDGVGTLSLGRTNKWAAVGIGAATADLSGNLTVGGKLTNYNGIATVAGGAPVEYAEANLTGQTAAIGPTTIYAVPASGAGMYRISYVATVTTVASVSSVLGGTNGFQVTYTNADGSVVVTTAAGPTSNLNTTQAHVSGVLVVYAKASTNLQFSFDYTSVNAAEMVYSLHVKVEAM